jgi:hypothetical protein
MKTAKKFDCVKMKDEIQRILIEERKGMTDKEYRLKIREELEKEDSPVGRLWKRLMK